MSCIENTYMEFTREQRYTRYAKKHFFKYAQKVEFLENPENIYEIPAQLNQRGIGHNSFIYFLHRENQ